MKMIILIFISCAAQIYKKMALENSEKFLILQLQDGPCPLVALVNFILLTSKSNIAVPETEDLNNAWIFDTLERHLINNEIMERGKVISTMTGFFDGTYLSPVLKSSIEFEKEILSNLFLHFNVKLFHCWVASEKVLNAFDAIDVRDVNMLSYLLTFSDMRKEHIAALRRELDETRVSIGRYEQDVQNLDQSLGDDLIDGSLTERKRLTEIISDLRAREEHLIRLDGDEGEVYFAENLEIAQDFYRNTEGSQATSLGGSKKHKFQNGYW